MQLSDLRRYSRFYVTPEYMGASGILRRWFALPDDFPVPLSISHGVDFGHSHFPQDVKAAEPIHWSYNRAIDAAARAYKPSLLLPHPWTMALHGIELPEPTGTLIVGAPPGPVNDRRLLELVRPRLDGEVSILVKARGAYRDSLRFWEEQGIAPVTAGAPDASFYSRLAQLLGGHSRVVGATFSSAVIFAAALGRRVDLVSGFEHRVYEGRDYESEVNWASPRGREVVRVFLADDQPAKVALARELLGADLAIDRAAKLAELEAMVAALRSPFYLNPDVRFPPPGLRAVLARAVGKAGLINAGAEAYFQRLRRTGLAIMTVNELDIWANGKSPANFRLDPVVAGGKAAVAGFAVEGYEQ